MSKHTSVPWVIYHNGDGPDEVVGVTTQSAEHLDSDGDGADICEMQNEGYFGREQMIANARLIAAAPELYDACNALLGLLQLLEGNPLTHPEIVQVIRTNHRVEEARAAIAKATGEA